MVDLVYGKSASGKTTWWVKLAAHLYETTGKKTRCYSGDGGSDTVVNSGLVDAGIVELFQYTIRPNPFETTLFSCRGKWPKDPQDPSSPWTDLPFGRHDYGLFVFEGLSAMAQHLLGALAELHAKSNGKFAQDTPFKFVDGTTAVAGNPMSDFGIVQGKIKLYIEESRRLGNVYWTAHQTTADDKETNEKIIGPDAGGKALTAKIGAHFGNTIHLDEAQKRGKERDKVTGKEIDLVDTELRAYTRIHYDPDGQGFTKFYANNRSASPEKMPLYLAPPDPIRFYALLKEGRKYDVQRRERMPENVGASPEH